MDSSIETREKIYLVLEMILKIYTIYSVLNF
jgi:hypothetical protein